MDVINNGAPAGTAHNVLTALAAERLVHGFYTVGDTPVGTTPPSPTGSTAIS